MQYCVVLCDLVLSTNYSRQSLQIWQTEEVAAVESCCPNLSGWQLWLVPAWLAEDQDSYGGGGLYLYTQ